MDTPPNTPTMGTPPQGPTGGGEGGLPALASCGTPTRQAAVDWGPCFVPEGDACRGDTLQRRLGVRVEGGDRGAEHALPPGHREGEGGGLGPRQDPGSRGPVRGDRLWSDAEVCDMWTLEAVNEGYWDRLQDMQAYWD